MRRSLVLGLVLVACNDAPAPPNLGSTGGTDSTTGTDTTGVGTVDTSGTTTVGPEPDVVLELDLEIEAIETVHVEVVRTGDIHEATLVASRGWGVAPDGEAVTGPARIDAYPEAGGSITTARLAGPPIPDGPCGDAPVSLALSLHRDDDTTFVAGGLTAYCGADTWYGVPPIEPLRISSGGP